MSKLILKILLNDIPDLYETEAYKDPLCHVKLFTPDGSWSWYIIEFSKEDLNTCYGYVVGLERELGYFTLAELEGLHGPLGLGVERDVMFEAMRLSEIGE